MSEPSEWTPENISELTATEPLPSTIPFDRFVREICSAHNAATAKLREDIWAIQRAWAALTHYVDIPPSPARYALEQALSSREGGAQQQQRKET